MSTFIILYTIATTSIALLLGMLTFIVPSRTKRHKRDNIKEQYIRLLMHLIKENPSTLHIVAHGSRQRMALAEAIYTMVSHTYGIDVNLFKQIATQNRLEELILRSARHSSETRRAHLLMLMSSLPLSAPARDTLRGYLVSDNALVRTSALLAMLVNEPTSAIRSIASMEFDLQPLDIARIITLLRRGVLPIAHEPLLLNNNRNLRMLGLALVRSFGITEAEKQLYHIIYTEKNHEVLIEAIYTLSSLGRPLNRTRIRERLAGLSATQRRDFCRHMTIEGYSLQTMQALFSCDESLYAEKIINTYKRGLTKIAATI